MEINISDFSSFIVIGKLRLSNKRFKHTYSGTYAGFMTANQINLYNGSMWGLTKEGKRKLLKRVSN